MKYILLILLSLLICQLFSNESVGGIMFEEKKLTNLDNWAIEKIKAEEGVVEVVDGKMKCTTVMDQKNGLGTDGIMIWLKSTQLPKNFKFEYDVTFLTNANDDGFFMLFFCYKHKENADLLDPQFFGKLKEQTLFKKYTTGTFDGYHISYRRGEAANCNLRKNAGMVLLHQTALNKVLPANQKMHVTLTKVGGSIKLEVDDVVFMDFKDDGASHGPIHESGRIGLRQVYKSSAIYENIKLHKLPE